MREVTLFGVLVHSPPGRLTALNVDLLRTTDGASAPVMHFPFALLLFQSVHLTLGHSLG